MLMLALVRGILLLKESRSRVCESFCLLNNHESSEPTWLAFGLRLALVAIVVLGPRLAL